MKIEEVLNENNSISQKIKENIKELENLSEDKIENLNYSIMVEKNENLEITEYILLIINDEKKTKKYLKLKK